MSLPDSGSSACTTGDALSSKVAVCRSWTYAAVVVVSSSGLLAASSGAKFCPPFVPKTRVKAMIVLREESI